MKKNLIACLLLLGCLTGCGDETTPKKAELSEKTLPGTFESVGITSIEHSKIVFNENKTFDASSDHKCKEAKGTWSFVESDSYNYVSLKSTEDEKYSITRPWVVYGDYLYSYDDGYEPFGCFSKDKEYGAKIMFDEEGHTNQTFESYDHNRNTPKIWWYQVNIVFSKDGSFTIYKFMRDQLANVQEREEFKGNYSLNETRDILTLNFDGQDHVCIIAENGNVYYDVLKKLIKFNH